MSGDTNPTDSTELNALRARVAEVDGRLVALVNERLRLVAQIKAHKSDRGIDFVDDRQEQRLIEERRRENAGPLSDEGVAELLREVLDLVKRELG